MKCRTLWMLFCGLISFLTVRGQSEDIILNAQLTTTGRVELGWRSCATTGMQTFSIYRSIASAPETLLRTMVVPAGAVLAFDTLWLCSATVHYRVEGLANGACQERSNTASVDYIDKIVPDAIDIGAVSVDPDTDEIDIFWSASKTRDAYGYFMFIGSSATLFDTVLGANEQHYHHDTVKDSSWFRISVFDSCYNRSLLSSERRFFRARLHQDMCAQRIRVSWDSVISAVDPKAIDVFELWSSVNQGSYTLLATYGADVRHAYVEDVRHHDHYKIYVRARHKDGIMIANSLSDTLRVVSAPAPRWVSIDNLSFVDLDHLQIEFDIDMGSVWSKVYLLGHSQSHKVDTLHKLSFEDLQKDSLLVFRDQQFQYSLMLLDTCGRQAGSTQAISPYRLEGDLNGKQVSLTWDPEVLWYPDVAKLEFLRILDEDTTFIAIGSVDQASYSEWIEPTVEPASLVYILKAYPRFTEGLYQVYSQSQPLVLISEDRVHIACPTALKRGGASFRPFYRRLSQDRFSMQIFDRFGVLVFESSDPDKGWDGQHKGREAHGGVYVYVIRLIRGDHLNEYSGTITLID